MIRIIRNSIPGRQRTIPSQNKVARRAVPTRNVRRINFI
jgi:hypothetical protein